MNASTPTQESLAAAVGGRLAYKWPALITAASGTLAATVTMSIVNISLPSIAQGFGASITTVQWVLVIYPLITVSIMLAVGYLGDVWGRKRIVVAGAIIFAAGSFLCGVAQDPWQLIAFRVVQAVGGAMVVANGAAIVTAAVPASERGKSLGMVSTVAAIGLSVGPTLGGILVDTLGWRWVFFVAVPLSMLTAALGALCLHDAPRRGKAQPFDVAGAVALFVSMASFLVALSEGQENGWSSARLAGLAVVFLISTVAFVLSERRAALPTVDLVLLGDRLFAAAAVAGMLAYMGMFAVMFLMPFYLTRTAGYSPSQAGTLLTAIPLAMAFMATIAGWLSDRFGSRWLCAGGMLLCTSSLLLLAQLDRTAAYAEIGGRLLLLGLGLGIFMSPNNSAVMGCVPVARLGMASALLATVRHLGAALGVAVAGAIFTVRLAAYTAPGAPDGGIFDAAASVGAFREAYLALALVCAVGIWTSLVRGGKG